MRAGKLRHRVTIERFAPSRDDAGSEVPVWESYATVWGSVEPLEGREGSATTQILADLDTVVTIRWSPQVDSVTPKWRVRHGGVTYDIVSVAHQKLGQREVVLACRSGVNSG